MLITKSQLSKGIVLYRKEIRSRDEALIFQLAGPVAALCSELCVSVGVVSLCLYQCIEF